MRLPAASANLSEATLTVTVSDGTTPVTATGTITVTAVNDAPTLTAVSTLTGATEDTALTISYETLAGAANEADAEGTALSFRVEAVSTGTLEKGSGSSWTAVTAGTTLLGASETVGALQAQAFAPMDCSHKLFRKQAVALARLIDVPSLGAQSVPLQPEMALPGVAGQPPEVLEAELLATRERLQEMVLELQASHERLDLGNEELTASNEELQSTNEELKSVNEDLYALNHELESKNAELAELNRDYDQLLDSTEIGIVFLDAALQLRRFSPAVSEFLALRSSDMGRPVREISYRLGPQDAFMAELQRCAGDKARIEREIRLPDGRWVYQRMLPFKDDSSLDGGVVLTWTDISEIKRMQSLAEQLAADRTRLLGILDVLPDGVYIVSQGFDIEYLNPALEREFGPIQGRKCYEYFHGRSSRCDWCKNQEVFAGKTVHWEWTSSKGRTYDLFDMPFHNPDGTVSKFEIFHDITDAKEGKRRMQEAAQLAQVGHWEWSL